MSVRRRSDHWFAVHALAMVLASLVAAVVLMRDAPFLALFAWPIVLLYAATVGSAGYTLALRLKRTSWIDTIAAGAIAGGWFSVFALRGEEFWPVLTGFGSAGIAGAVVFRATVVGILGTAWLRESAAPD